MTKTIKIDLNELFDNAFKFINNKHQRILNKIKDFDFSSHSDQSEFQSILYDLEQVALQYRSLHIVHSLLVEISYEKDF